MSPILTGILKKDDLGKEIAYLEQRVLEAERQREDALDRLRDKNHELYEVKCLDLSTGFICSFSSV